VKKTNLLTLCRTLASGILFEAGGKGRAPSGASGSMDRLLHGSRQNNEQDFKHIAAVFSISTAFLDNVCKSDKFAQSWLLEKANQWLKKSADLKTK